MADYAHFPLRQGAAGILCNCGGNAPGAIIYVQDKGRTGGMDSIAPAFMAGLNENTNLLALAQTGTRRKLKNSCGRKRGGYRLMDYFFFSDLLLRLMS